MSPHLSKEENEELFGIAASPFGHGHHYQARVTFDRSSGAQKRYLGRAIGSSMTSRSELDHKNLNHEVPALRERPITTESLAQWMFERLESAGAAGAHSSARARRFLRRVLARRPVLPRDAARRSAPRIDCMSDVIARTQTSICSASATTRAATGISISRKRRSAASYDERSGTLHSFDGLQDAIARGVAAVAEQASRSRDGGVS